MARFLPNEPVVTSEPLVTVDAGLPVGQHRFQLVVEDDQGNRSVPDVRVVTVVARVVRVTGTVLTQPVRP